MDDLYTRKQAAAYMKICTRTLDKWIKDGELKAIKLGRRVILRKIDIDNFLNFDEYL